MNDADELARRYFALWTEYLTALVADPQAAELLQRWVAFTGQFAAGQFAPGQFAPGQFATSPFPGRIAGAAGERGGTAFPLWPPTPFGLRAAGSPPAAASAAGAPGERGPAVDELARRVGELERRLAALEQRPGPRRPRRGNRADGE